MSCFHKGKRKVAAETWQTTLSVLTPEIFHKTQVLNAGPRAPRLMCTLTPMCFYFLHTSLKQTPNCCRTTGRGSHVRWRWMFLTTLQITAVLGTCITNDLTYRLQTPLSCNSNTFTSWQLSTSTPPALLAAPRLDCQLHGRRRNVCAELSGPSSGSTELLYQDFYPKLHPLRPWKARRPACWQILRDKMLRFVFTGCSSRRQEVQFS